jgi:hypothetical protein
VSEESQAYTETVDDIGDFPDAAPDRPGNVAGDDISHEPVDAPEDDISEGEAGIPDEPEAFVEELRAQADLPETGDPRVDEVLAGLSGIENLPTAEHVAVYDQAHRGLQDALANLDQG